MISSINFLFLTSLAITSWVILCYFKQIEVQQLEQQQQHQDINVEFNMENVFEESLKPSCRENYDIYLNFFCIFACVYALAKITNITENYIAKHVHARLGRTSAQYNSDQCQTQSDIEPPPQQMESKTIEDYRVCQQNLMLQIAFLEKENYQLEGKLEELQQQMFQLRSAVHNFPMCARSSKSSILNSNRSNHCCSSGTSLNTCVNSELENHIFLSKRHFQLTRQVYMNEGNVKLNFQDLPEEGGDFSKIWQKYLEMQKYAVQKSITPPAGAQVENNLPVVISTEELQTINGFY